METVNRLSASGSVTLDADGRGVIVLGPGHPNLKWRITNVAVSTISMGGSVPTGTGTATYVIAENQDFVNNTTTLHNDAELSFDVEADSVYVVEVYAMFRAAVNCDLQTSWAAPAGSSGLKQCLGATSTAAAFTSRTQAEVRIGGHLTTTAAAYQLDTSGQDQLVWERGVLHTSGTAGAFVFQFTQNSATVGNLTRDADSYLVWTKVA